MMGPLIRNCTVAAFLCQSVPLTVTVGLKRGGLQRCPVTLMDINLGGGMVILCTGGVVVGSFTYQKTLVFG